MFQRSLYTDQLIDLLLKVPKGATISYKELSEAISIDVQEPAGRGYLETAKKALLLDHQIEFRTVVGEGQQRLDFSGKLRRAEADEKRLHRAAQRSRRKLVNCPAEELKNASDEEVSSYNARRSICEFLLHFSSRKTTRKLEKQIGFTTGPLPIGAFLSALKGK